MKPNQTDAELRRLFVDGAQDAVSSVFTAQLVERLQRERLPRQSGKSFTAKWLGKVTICVLLGSNALVLSRLDIFAASPEVVCAVFAFVVGAFSAAPLMKKLNPV